MFFWTGVPFSMNQILAQAFGVPVSRRQLATTLVALVSIIILFSFFLIPPFPVLSTFLIDEVL